MRRTVVIAVAVAITAASACGKKQDAPPAPPTIVKPEALTRVAGDETIQPDAETARAMIASGRGRIVTSWKVCIDPTGAVDEVKSITSSGFLAWDQALAAGIRTWRFQPYQVGGAAVRACTSRTFAWTSK
jgi:TonB family protein